MCGISSLVNCGGKSILREMTNALAHRGPDDAGMIWFDDVLSGLGHRRLSILDLSAAGHQPMCNETKTVWVVLNGEIYNYKQIREELRGEGFSFRSNSDTEVLLKAYEAWGEAALGRLNGIFAFVIYDSTRKKFFAARDRIGVKPLYYALTDGGLILASEIKAILSTGLVEKTPDFIALHTPTRFQVAPSTGFQGIKKLPPGSSLRFEENKLTIETYWKLASTEGIAGGDVDVVGSMDRLVADSVRLQTIADVPVGVLLSGGLDSSIISALMRRGTSGEIHAFTVRNTDADQSFEKMPQDSYYAHKVADLLGLTYHEITLQPDIVALLPRLVWHLDEPVSDPATIVTYLIGEAARKEGIRVLLNGMGGDEIFGGYRKHVACLLADKYRNTIPEFFRRSIAAVSDGLPVATSRRGLRFVRWSKRFTALAMLPRPERYMMSDLSLTEQQYAELFVNGPAYRDTMYWQAEYGAFLLEDVSYLAQMCLNDTRIFLAEHNLLYSDKALMAVGVEGRSPLTDHRIVEFMFSVPPQFRIRRGVQKWLLKEVAKAYLPPHIVNRPKASFGAPLRSWIRGPLAPMVQDLLSERSVRQRGLYNPRAVAKLISDDRQGWQDNAHLIWTMLTTEVWFRTFFNS